MSEPFDCAVVGGGLMGCSTALFLARAGMRVVLLDRGPLCRGASGVNAGTLTMQMIRAVLIPYGMQAWQMWMTSARWLDGGDVLARARQGLSVAFTEAEAAMLEQRARARAAAGAPIVLVDGARARAIEPGLSPVVRLAAHCTVDGFASAYLTGRAFRGALVNAGVTLREGCAVSAAEQHGAGFVLQTAAGPLAASRLVLCGGVWLEPMLAWFGLQVPVKTLVNQLVVTEPMSAVMQTVLGVASGLLSLKQYENGSVLIGGGWQGIGDRERGAVAVRPENLIGNVRLAAYTIPALREANVLRAWVGLESETADALPAMGPIPGITNAWVLGCVHSGYAIGPYMGKLMAQAVCGEAPEMPLFPIDRLLVRGDA